MTSPGLSLPAGADVILCADDFAITEGVSRGIEELAAARRLSATSALVTLPPWERHAERAARLRQHVAVGLHVNLTLGRPLGSMPALAPAGTLPSLGSLARQGLLGRIDAREISGEVTRQLERFERLTGHPPDFIDGHQHAHAARGVRDGLLLALGDYFSGRHKPLVRDPSDRLTALAARGGPVAKALAISLSASGFGAMLRAAGFPTNYGFAGVSAFDPRQPYLAELARFFTRPGPRHLVMCHPGHPDPELAALDPVVGRRRDELEAIMSAPGLVGAIWHVVRRSSDGPPCWPQFGPPA